jgi:hypothetical protein
MVGVCKAGHCPLLVRLRKGSRALDTVPLDWSSPSRRLQLEPIVLGSGVGDTLGPPPGMNAWAAAIDQSDYVSTFVRPVSLTHELIGLLVTQRRGAEPVKRWHALFIVISGHLRIVWQHKEGDGPTWSATRIVPAGDKREQILFIEGYALGSEGGGENSDRLELKVLWWDDRHGRLIESPAGEKIPLQVVSFGSYATAAQANEARSHNDCLFRYWILDAQRYEGLSTGRYFIGTISSDPALAKQAVAETKACAPSGSILPFKERK